MSENATLMLMAQARIASAKIEALTQIVSTLLARSAQETTDPQAYIISALSPVHALSEAFDPTDEEMSEVGEAILELAEQIENSALVRLRSS
jgi:hypothetical protein